MVGSLPTSAVWRTKLRAPAGHPMVVRDVGPRVQQQGANNFPTSTARLFVLSSMADLDAGG